MDDLWRRERLPARMSILFEDAPRKDNKTDTNNDIKYYTILKVADSRSQPEQFAGVVLEGPDPPLLGEALDVLDGCGGVEVLVGSVGAADDPVLQVGPLDEPLDGDHLRGLLVGNVLPWTITTVTRPEYAVISSI
jgi:hypothetical protein